MALRHALAIAIAVIGFGAAGCSSGRPTMSSRIPFPVGVDDCSVYCRVWVPPTYRDVPKVVCCKQGRLEREVVCANRVEFDEVCRPGSYVKKRSPCSCHKEEAIVQDCPGSDRWVPTTCGCACADCYRHERIPPTYKLCEKTVTDKGVEYCAYHEPEYDVVACSKTVKECVDVYKPGQYGVKWEKELFQCGHWEWKKCNNPPNPCDCGPGGASVRKGFGCAPCKD